MRLLKRIMFDALYFVVWLIVVGLVNEFLFGDGRQVTRFSAAIFSLVQHFQKLDDFSKTAQTAATIIGVIKSAFYIFVIVLLVGGIRKIHKVLRIRETSNEKNR